MFDIEYKGANCVVISSKNDKIVIDPKLSIVGLKDMPTKDMIEIATDRRYEINDRDARIVIDGPGDYGISDFDIHGVAARRNIDPEGTESTMYRLEIGDSRIGIIGNVYEKLSDEQLEELGVLDVLVIPVGGNGYTLDATGAAGLVRLISPKYVIPVHYNDKAITYEVAQNDLALFFSELGAPVEVTSKFKFKPGLVQNQLTIIELTRS